MDTGTIIRERRRALHLTQQALGEMCGYSQQSAQRTVRRWEHGDRDVPLNKLRALAAALQIPLDTLIP